MLRIKKYWLLAVSFLFITSISIFKSNEAKGQTSFDLPGHFVFDFGLAVWNDYPEEMQLSTWGSRGVNMAYFYEIQLGSEKFTLNPGLGLWLQSYNFKQNAILGEANGRLTYALDPTLSYKKTKLAANYLTLPLEFRFRTNPGRNAFRVGFGGRVNYLYSSHTKVKFKDADGNMVKAKTKDDFLLEKLQYGITGRIGFSSINLFAYYNLNNVFEESALPENNPTTLVIGITLKGL